MANNYIIKNTTMSLERIDEVIESTDGVITADKKVDYTLFANILFSYKNQEYTIQTEIAKMVLATYDKDTGELKSVNITTKPSTITKDTIDTKVVSAIEDRITIIDNNNLLYKSVSEANNYKYPYPHNGGNIGYGY